MAGLKTKRSVASDCMEPTKRRRMQEAKETSSDQTSTFQGTGMSIFRFSAKFRFFFFFGPSAFFKNEFSLFFQKSPKEKNTGLRHGRVRSASVNSHRRPFAGVRFFRFRSKFESVVWTKAGVSRSPPTLARSQR